MLNFDWLSGVSPGTARLVFLGLFVVIGLLVSAVPRAAIYEGVARPRWWHNLKLWAWGVLLSIFIVYCLF